MEIIYQILCTLITFSIIYIFQPRGDFRNDGNNHADNHQGDSEIMNRGNRNHIESGRGGRRGGGAGNGGFRGGPPNRGDDRLSRADVSIHINVQYILFFFYYFDSTLGFVE